MAQPLRPRYYSTSSSPRIHGDGIAHLTVALETTPVPGMPDRDFRGISSHYLHTLREGDRLDVFLDSADGFHLQEDVTKPMIFVSAGTGFAPMRAFLWERLAMKRAGVALAEAALFNGIRSSGLDYIYRDEIGRFATEGVLNHVHLATSRERPGRRDHVQDRSANRAHWSGACSPAAATSTSAARSRCATPSAPPSSTSSPSTGRCRAEHAAGLPGRAGNDRPLPPRPLGLTLGARMDVLALILTAAAMVMFLFAASGRELRRFNEIAIGLVFLDAALICQFTSITNTHIGR